MYAELDQLSQQELDGLVKNALNEGWQDRTAKVLKGALEQLTWDVGDYIGAELEGFLQEHIQSAARRSSEAFLDALAKGDEAQVQAFLQLPNAYWKQRENSDLGSLFWSRDIGPMDLRRKMIEAVQDRLEREVILDQEAEIMALRNSLEKADRELREWRTGDRS